MTVLISISATSLSSGSSG